MLFNYLNNKKLLNEVYNICHFKDKDIKVEEFKQCISELETISFILEHIQEKWAIFMFYNIQNAPFSVFLCLFTLTKEVV